MEKRLVLKIYGLVQGVNFRWETKEFARQLGLVGWVRNEPDGTVRVVAEGPKEVLQKLLKFCYNGVKFAKVDNVDISWQEPTGEFSDFSIKY
jgi:acylphosphatase